MKTKICRIGGRSTDSALTVVELAVVLAVLVVLALLLLPKVGRAHHKASRIACVHNLKQIGLALALYVEDQGIRFFASVDSLTLANARQGVQPSQIFGTMSNMPAATRILYCPSDLANQPASDFAGLTFSNISYFAGLSAAGYSPQSFLAGDRNLTTNDVPAPAGLLLIGPGADLGWSEDMHRYSGFLALADGSVHQATRLRLREIGTRQATGTHWLWIP